MTSRPAPTALSLRLLAVSLGLAAVAVPGPAAAQREIVQPLPRAEATDLNSALRRLSANPNDVGALIEAGEASLALGDVDAASGFFIRAQNASPSNGPARLGLARIALGRGEAVDALRLFDEAERAGVPAQRMAAERGFAYDLVGDAPRAQTFYRQALATGEDGEIRRRLALSLAISGQRQAFEETLYPLLKDDDRAAFRTRAFGLAIMGQEAEAMTIAETMLPTDLALRMAPYLRYMTRLTPAQQAAAANLGVFPPTSQIGRDEAEVAAFATQGQRIARNADTALTPTGQVLGQQRNPTEAPREAAPARTQAEPAARAQRNPPANARSTTRAQRRRQAEAQPTTPPVQDTAPVRIAGAQPAVTSSPVPSPSAQAEVAPVVVAQVPSIDVRTREVESGSMEAVEMAAAIPVPSIATIELPPSEPARENAVVLVAADSPPPAPVVPAQQPASVADAFADLGSSAVSMATPGIGAVDITSIRPPREVEKVEPAAPAHPSRHWVQVATGKDQAALKFDWRRIARKADGKLEGKGPFVTPWGEANRLLSGPYDSATAAREKMNELKSLEIDSFTFTSDAGQAIEPLR